MLLIKKNKIKKNKKFKIDEQIINSLFFDNKYINKYINYAKNNDINDLTFFSEKLVNCLPCSTIDNFISNLEDFIYLHSKYFNKNYILAKKKINYINKVICYFNENNNHNENDNDTDTDTDNDKKKTICNYNNEIINQIVESFKSDKEITLKFIIKNLNFFQQINIWEKLKLKNYFLNDKLNFTFIFITEFKKYCIEQITNPEKKCLLYFNVDDEEIKSEMENESQCGELTICSLLFLLNFHISSNIQNNLINKFFELFNYNLQISNYRNKNNISIQ